jgi:hypothetical protein
MTAVVIAAPNARAADEPVPAKLAMMVMLRVLTYDKNFSSHGSGDFLILVAHEPGQETALKNAMAASAELKDAAMQAKPSRRSIRFVTSEFRGPAGLKEAAQKEKANALLVLPGLSAEGLDAAVQVARELQLYSITLEPAYVEKGVGVGVVGTGGKPVIVLNMATARALNAAFEPAVLRLARIVQ